MIKKRIKNISKLIGLITVRQLWKLADNLYDLISTPIVALKKVWKIRDKSQIFLIAMTAVSPILMYVLARIVWDYYRYKHMVLSGGLFFGIAASIEIIILTYLGYWILRSTKRE